MLREAELLVAAERMLVEVLGRVRPEHAHVVLPAMHPGATTPMPVPAAVQRHLAYDRRLAALLGAGDAPVGTVAEAAAAVCAAAARLDDGDAQLAGLPAPELLLRATLDRSLFGHYLATTGLGSTACPLPEELARPLWELTAPDAERWRQLGWFRAPLPLPDHVSWRDRFLRDAGHEPHPH